ncbi:MAG: pilus assembly protein N-terminal domain-containing protein [Fimbriiglobus sp.]|jgi:pilus assembly protein CpaC|nr:pilus assembly protein N-terminal domain-containing protein [Fimbriiglobus sp.]
MHLTTIFRRRMLAGMAAVAGLVGGSAVAQQPQPATAQPGQTRPPQAGQTPDTGDIKVGKLGELLVPLSGLASFDPKTGQKITALEVSNGDVLDAKAVAPDLTKVQLTGKLGGASRLRVVFADRSEATYTVIVQPDYEQLKFVLKRAVPTANIDVIPGVGNVIILSGMVTRPEEADTAIRIASSAVGGNVQNVINALNIGGSQHVAIDVTVAQVDRTEIKERGFAFGAFGQNFQVANVLGGLATLPQGGGGGGGNPLQIGTANIAFSIVPGQFVGALRALRTEGLAKFLSEPKLVTMSGRPALLRAGGRQAVLSPQVGLGGAGAILEPVGTELEVLPIVRGDGKIYLELNPRITSVNNGRGLNTASGFTPGFNEQQTRTSVVLEPGQTFAIAGLLETSVQASAEKVPYLGDMPLIGSVFSSVRHDERETELLILVTPRLQEPMNCDQVGRRVPGKETRTPDDYELFLEGLVEAPRGQRKVWNGRHAGYNTAWKCNPAGFPCVGNVCGQGGAACPTGTCNTPGGLRAPTPADLVPIGPNTGAAPVVPSGSVVPSGGYAPLTPAPTWTKGEK